MICVSMMVQWHFALESFALAVEKRYYFMIEIVVETDSKLDFIQNNYTKLRNNKFL